MITRPDEYGHNNPDLAFVDSTFVRGGTRAVANLTALYALSSKVDQLAERITRVWVASEAKYYVLTNIASVGSAGGWTAEQTNSTLQQVTDNGATTTNTITAAGFTTAGNLTAGGIVSTNQFYAGATNYTNSIFVGWDATAVYLGYQMGNLFIDIGTGVTNKVRLRNTGGFQIESLAGSGDRMMVVDANGNVSVQSIPTGSVTSVFGRTGAVTAQSGDYNTSQVTESGNLYYTDARARAALSAGTGISYNSTTGVISYSGTVYTDSSIRGLFSAGAGISYNSTTGAISSTITQYTDANARAALSFAAGSGAYNSTTGVITIPTNNNQLTNGAGYITGNQTITISGDASGSGATSISLTLANSGVSAGTYTKVTVDAKGRVTSGTTLASADLPTYTGTLTSSQVTTALGFTPANSSALGTYAYRSSGLAELSGATFTGAISGTSASFSSSFSATTGQLTGSARILGLRKSSAFTGNLYIGFQNESSSEIAFIGYGSASTNVFSILNALGDVSLQQSGGNVGIGTTSPAGPLQVVGTADQIRSGNGTVTSFLGGSGSNGYTGTLTNHDFQIYTNSSVRLTISSTGAATFSSSVQATANASGRSGLFGGASFGLRIDNAGSFNNGGTTLHGVDNTFVASYQKLSLNGSSLEFMTDYSTKLTIANNGAATFSSSVTAGGDVTIAGITYANRIDARSGNPVLFWNPANTEYGRFSLNSSNTLIYNVGGGSTLFSITSTGAATFSSSVTATGFFESSDARKKTIIERYAGSGVDTCKYIFNETGLDHYGYIAQEVEKVLPNAVTTREDGMKDVRYSEVHTFKIMLLENHIERLEGEIKLLKNAIQ